MRWNCPHCKKLVTAGINFETTEKAYVRCKNCNGMSLVHRSAMIAKYLEARRLEEEAAAEKRILAKNVATTTPVSMKTAVPPVIQSPTLSSPPPFQAASAGMDMHISHPSNLSAPPFQDATGFDPIVESSGEGATAAALPVFNYAKPPAFLLKEKRIEPTAFTEGSTSEVNKTQPSSISGLNVVTARLKTFLNSSFAVWVAAALAIASGYYLFLQGQRSLESISTTHLPEQTSTISKQ